MKNGIVSNNVALSAVWIMFNHYTRNSQICTLKTCKTDKCQSRIDLLRSRIVKTFESKTMLFLS